MSTTHDNLAALQGAIDEAMAATKEAGDLRDLERGASHSHTEAKNRANEAGKVSATAWANVDDLRKRLGCGS